MAASGLSAFSRARNWYTVLPWLSRQEDKSSAEGEQHLCSVANPGCPSPLIPSWQESSITKSLCVCVSLCCTVFPAKSCLLHFYDTLRTHPMTAQGSPSSLVLILKSQAVAHCWPGYPTSLRGKAGAFYREEGVYVGNVKGIVFSTLACRKFPHCFSYRSFDIFLPPLLPTVWT